MFDEQGFQNKMMKQIKFRELVHAILDKGTRYPKKHGSWISLKIGDNEYLYMDSWNSAIFKGTNVVYSSYTTGFSARDIIYIGIDWGAFECYVTDEYLDELLDKIEKL